MGIVHACDACIVKCSCFIKSLNVHKYIFKVQFYAVLYAFALSDVIGVHDCHKVNVRLLSNNLGSF